MIYNLVQVVATLMVIIGFIPLARINMSIALGVALILGGLGLFRKLKDIKAAEEKS